MKQIISHNKAKIGLLLGLGAILALCTLSSGLGLATPFALQYPNQYQPNQFSSQTTAATTQKAFKATVITYISSSAQKQIYSVFGSEDAVVGQKATMSLVNSVAPPAVTARGSQYFSLSDIKANAPSIKANGGSIVGYDFESIGTPTSELSNPVASFQQAYNIATSNGLVLQCSPTMSTALKYAPQIAKYCAIFNGQGEHNEANTAQYITNYNKLSSEVRAANPNSKIIAEVSTTAPGATLSIMEYDFSHVAQYVDGTTCWFSSSTLSTLQSYVTWFNQHY